MHLGQHRAECVCSRTRSFGRHHKLSPCRRIFRFRDFNRVLGGGSNALPVWHRHPDGALLWLFILLTSIPFVLICFLLVRLVAPLPFKDVLHLSFYPIGAGVFAGAVFALVASAIVALLVAVGFIPDIKFDFSQVGEGLSRNAYDRLVTDCLKERSLLYIILASGLGDGYTNLKAPFGTISYIRPTITLLYLVIAGLIFMALWTVESRLCLEWCFWPP